MATIDVGPGATVRSTTIGGNTYIDKANPANGTGTIDHLDAWMSTGIVGDIDLGSFEEVSPDTFTTRGSVTVTPAAGDNDFDAPGDFTAFAIAIGDYLGAYTPQFKLSFKSDATGGSGYWWKAGDNIPCTGAGFAFTSAETFSIYGTGVEASSYIPQIMMIG